MRRLLIALLFPLLAMGAVGVFRRGRPEDQKRPPLLRLLPGGPTSAQIAAGTLAGSKGETVTTVRASSKACTQAAGTLTTLSSNSPCVESAGLLVEPAHTNLLLQSQALGTTWGQANAVATNNQTTAPDGTSTATQIGLVPSASYSTVNQGMTLSGIYTMSIWLKAASATQFYLDVGQDPTHNHLLCNVTTSWQRFSVTTPSLTSGTWYPAIGYDNRSGAEVPLGSYPIVYAWGASLETGKLAHSYVATTTTSATGAADVVSLASSKLPLGSGSIWVDFTPRWATASSPSDAYAFDSTASHTVGLGLDLSSGAPVAWFGGSSISVTSPGWTAAQKYTLRFHWSGGTYSLYRGGVLLKSAAASSPSSHGTLYLGSYSGTGGLADGWLSNLKVTR